MKKIRKRFAFLVAVGLIICLIINCASCRKDNNAKHYFLFDITKNSTFDITMKSYGGTAYVWSYEIFPSSGIEYVSREFVSDRAELNLTGGGQLKYTFRAMSIGSYKIKFEARTLSDSNQDSPIEVNIYEITIVE